MNNKRFFIERWNYYNKNIILNNQWLQAFIDDKGSFYFTITKTTNRKKPYTAYIATLSISQSSHSVKLLKAIVEFFGVGYLKPKYDITDKEIAKSVKISRCILNQYAVVIKFVDRYPMFTLNI